MRAAFVCWRPYQVFNAINMVYNNTEGTRENSDLYIQDLPALKKIVPHLEKLGLFRNIYLFSELNHGDTTDIGALQQLKIYAVRTWNFVFAHSALKRNCQGTPEDGFKQYDLLLASGWISFFIELANCNPNARVVLFEDGTGTYVSDQIETLPSIRRKYYGLLQKVFHKGPFCVDISALYVYDPALMVGQRKYPVRQLEKIHDELYDVLCAPFGFDPSDRTYIGKPFVFLGQPLIQANDPKYNEIDLVKALAENHPCVYRKHPLQRDLEILACEDQNRYIWELACRGIDEHCTLIAAFSTAQLTPKILYGHEPKLILLHKISFKKDSRVLDNIQGLMSRFKQNYGNDIYEPETVEEFLQIVDTLSKQ